MTKLRNNSRRHLKNKLSHLETKMKDMNNVITEIKDEVGIDIVDLLNSKIRKINHTDVDAKEWISEFNFPEPFQNRKITDPYCWGFNSNENKKGYYRVGQAETGMEAHRLIYIVFNNNGNQINSKIQICHICNTKTCVNPNHLVALSSRENNKHKITHYVPCQRVDQKLTIEDAKRIRELYASGMFTHEAIAKQYKVSRKLVNRICLGELWQHAGGPITKNFSRKPNQKVLPNSKKAKDIKKIRDLYAKGVSQLDLANMFKISQTAIGKIVNNEWFKDV